MQLIRLGPMYVGRHLRVAIWVEAIAKPLAARLTGVLPWFVVDEHYRRLDEE